MPPDETFIALCPEAIVGLDSHYRIRLFNPAAERLFGYTAAELMGQSIEQLVPDRSVARVRTAIATQAVIAAAARLAGSYHEWTARHQDGRELTLEVAVSPIDSDPGRADQCQVLAFAHNITARKQVENQLRQLWQAIEQSPATIVITDPDGRIEYANPKFTATTGYTLGEALGQNPRILKSGHTPSDEYRQLWATISAGREWHGEFHNKKKDGELYWEWASISPILNAQGEITNYLAVKEDITARKAAEADRARYLSLVQATLDSTADGILVIDVDRRVTIYNRKFVELWRIPADIVASHDDRQLLTFVLNQLKDPAGFLAKVEEMYGRPDAESFDVLEFADGRIFERYSQPQQIDHQTVGRVWSFRDITGQKRAETGLQASALENQQLYEAAGRQRDELAALHDIEQAISALDVDRCLQAVATHAQSLMQAYIGRVFLIEADGLCLQAASGVGAEQVGQLVLPIGQGLCGWAAEHREVAHAPDTLTDVRYAHTISSTRSEVAIPLIYETDVIGVLDVQSERENAFSAGDIDLLKRLAAQAAIAIRNARLFHAEQDQRVLAEALRDTAAALNSSLNLDEVLDRILDNVGQVVAHDAANIMLIDGGLAKVTRARGYDKLGLHDWMLSMTVLTKDLFSLDRLSKSDTFVLVPDTRAEPGWFVLPQTGWIRSYVGVPIWIQDRVAGILNLDSATPGFFTAAHGERLRAFASQAAIAIENARLISDSRRQAERERLINEITNRIRGSLDIDEIIKTTVQELGRILGASRCLIRLGADANYMPVAFEFDQPGVQPLDKHNPALLMGTREKLLARQTLALDNTLRASPQLHQLGIRAVLATPIMVRKNLLGALIFHECRQPRHWLPDEIDLIETIAGQVGVAIENARLYHETRRQLSELAILHSAAIATADSTSLDEALHKVAQAVYDALGDVSVAVMLIKPDTDDLHIYAGLGYAASDLAAIQMKVGQGVTGWVAQTGQPAMLPDVSTDPRYVCQDPSIRSELCVPLRTGSRVVGVLNVESRQLDAFTERDLQLLTTLSHNLTIIVENIRLLEEVRAANSRLKELDRLKSQFLANMSHELRTPLNAIIGFSELISDGLAGPTTPEQADYLNNINASGRHLLALINDILDLSKIQAGRMTLDRQRLTVTGLVAEVQAIIAPLTARKQQPFDVQIMPNLPPIEVDPLRLKQVLINLLGNASKFTPEGGQVTLRITRIESDLLLFSVSDTGRGIPPAAQDMIFEEFRQAQDAADREEGTGLGLAIARRLIELHGGRIWVESSGQPGLGATFYFTLPTQPDQPTPPAADQAAPATALIIEDDLDFSGLLALHLRQAGYQTRQCYSGQAARTALQEQMPQLITLDMQLPDVSGWTLLQEIKDDPALRHTGILIISGQELAQVAATPGSIEVLTKPILRHQLATAIERLKNRPPDRPLRILLVDDDPMLLELLAAILPPPAYEVVTAINGAYASDQIMRQSPDLVILDLLMPDMNGFELLAALRRNPLTRALPVIVLSAKVLSPAEQAELTQTAQCVMTKTSLRRDRLLAEIHRLRQTRLVP